jgi:hypothetical protein
METAAALAILAAPFVALIVLVGWRLGAEVVRRLRDDRPAALTSEALREALQSWAGDAPGAAGQHDRDEPTSDSGLPRESDVSPVPAAEGGSHLAQQPGEGPIPKDVVPPPPMTAGGRGRCPACSAPITTNDERCPSCDIAFVADGPQKWTAAPVGPADGIYLPPTEVGE